VRRKVFRKVKTKQENMITGPNQELNIACKIKTFENDIKTDKTKTINLAAAKANEPASAATRTISQNLYDLMAIPHS
jgi:hypothetical protein